MTDQPGEAARRDRYRAVYEANFHRILGYALRRCPNRDDAADVAAETLLVAWRRLDELPAGEEQLWLYGVARRVLANQRRGELRRRRLGELLRTQLERLPPLSPGPDVQGDRDELAGAMAGLREADREVILLAAWEGLAGPELARVLGCSTNAAKIRLHRARRRLARLLEEPAAEAVAAKPPVAGGHGPGEPSARADRRTTKEEPA